MNKFYGEIGFAITTEKSPGVWIEKITSRNYYGDITRSTGRMQGSDRVNSDVNLAHTLSIVADPFAFNHYGQMRYVAFGNTKWKVESVELAFPRLIITTGGVYNGESSGTA